MHSHSHSHSCNCKQHLDEDTQVEVQVLEGMQNILDQSYLIMNPVDFQRVIEKSFNSLYNLNQKHWYKTQFHSLKVLTSIMEKWINKYKVHGRLLILYYLSQAMNTSSVNTDDSLEYIDKAKVISQQQIYDAKHLIPKICVIEGDLLSNLQPESALESYQYAIDFCRKNCFFFPSKQKTFDLKQSMIESLFKSAMITKSLEVEGGDDVLELLEQTKRYAIEVQGHKSYLVSQLEAMCYNQRVKSKQDTPKHQDETVHVQEKMIQIGHGNLIRQLVLKINYIKNQQRLIVVVEDKENQEMRSKSVPLALKSMSMIDNIKNNIEEWINVDKNLKITVDEKSLEKISEGETVTSKHQQKHKMIKLIKKSQMFKNLFDNTHSQIDKQLISKKIEDQNQI